MDGLMVPSRRAGSADARHAGWEADVARGDNLPPEEETERFLRGMAWAAAISAPFWCAILAALIWF
jgi:hypothetical protein